MYVVALIKVIKKLPMRGWNFIVYLLFFSQFVSIPAYAQNDSDRWILKEILKDSTYAGEIVCQSYSDMGPMFWPADLSLSPAYTGHDYLIKNKRGLFIAIEGTGRIYKITKNAGELDFVRIDSTTYLGYNFGAFVFSYNDTIYSLGGYGFWNLNGHLRYFKESSSGWQINPVNRKIPVSYKPIGLYIDQNNYSLHYVTDQHHVDEALKSEVNDEYSTAKVFELNLKTRDWKELGTPTQDFMKLSEVSTRIAMLPWGELIFTGLKAQLKLETTLFDYRSNKIFLSTIPDKLNVLVDLIYNEEVRQNKRFITYYHDSVLTILTSNQKRLDIPLIKSDFTDTGMSIYVPLHNGSIWNTRNVTSLGILTALVVLTLGFVFWNRRRLIPTRNPIERSNTIVFDQTEQELIKRFLAKPEFSLSIDEVDQILDSTKKSKDVQNQKRSAVTRSVNNKFAIVTGDQSNLISTSRLEFDRRMIRYVLHVDKFKMIDHLLK